MKPTEHPETPAATPEAGIFATLRGLLHADGSSAPTAVPKRLRMLCAGWLHLALVVHVDAPLPSGGTAPTSRSRFAWNMPRSWHGRLAVIFLVTLAAFVGQAAPSARADDTHEYLAGPSAAISSGAPAGVALPGALSGVDAMAVDPGAPSDLWVSEKLEGTTNSRTDEFDADTGAFEAQLDQVPSLEVVDQGVAVDPSSHDVYVGANNEAGNGVLAAFGPSGSLLHTWTGAGTVNKSFTQDESGEKVGELAGVATDDSSGLLGDWAAGDVYVATGSPSYHAPRFNIVDVFKPTVGGEEPTKPVAELEGTCPATGMTCSGAEVVPFEDPRAIAVSAFNGDVLVADEITEGEAIVNVVDVFKPAAMLEGHYEFVETIKETPAGALGTIYSLAVDGGTGEIYIAEERAGPEQVVDEFSAGGEYLGDLTATPAGPFTDVQSVAVDPASHDVYVGDYHLATSTGSVDVFGPDIVIPDVKTEAATEATPTSATLNGTVNTAGGGGATCQFVWGTTTAFGKVAPCSAAVAEGESPVHAVISNLLPDTTYYYRLQATNTADGHSNLGEPFQDQSVTTLGAGIDSESAAEVGDTSATLNATIEPNGEATSYYFEYGTGGEYNHTAPAPPGTSIGLEKEVQVPPTHLQGLTANTTYDYRVLAVSELAPGKFYETEGAGHTFTTQAPGGELVLPDGRQWEMVSPPEKRGALILPLLQNVIQASPDGSAITYQADAPTEPEAQGNPEEVQVLSTRGGTGWQSHDLALPITGDVGHPIGDGEEYRIFSSDLSQAIVQPSLGFDPGLSPEASEQTGYVRSTYLNGDLSEFCTTSCYRPLVTGCPQAGAPCRAIVEEHADVPPGTSFGEEAKCTGAGVVGLRCGPQAVGATPDLSHVLLKSPLALTGTPLVKSTPAEDGLYEWGGGALQLVSVLPKNAGGTATVGVFGGTEEGRNAEGDTRNAISADGSRVIWAQNNNSHLYLRDTGKDQTVQLDSVQPGVVEEGLPAPSFQIASSNGTRVFFTDTQRLTADSGATTYGTGAPDLYECAIVEEAGELKCDLTDLTPKTGLGESADVLGVLGASEDGSWVYFVANGVLASGAEAGNCPLENGTVGTCNLYVRHDGATRLVAVLSSEDFPDWKPLVENMVARVSPNGEWVAFMSQESLTGYDNRDVHSHSGRRDEEAFLYDAGAGRVVCVSCDPTGARPVGVEYQNEHFHDGPVAGPGLWKGSTWLAADLPGGSALGPTVSLYQQRSLSNGGRLFFDSDDPLVPQDVNGTWDVYEYEPPGGGEEAPPNDTCTTESSTYSSRSGGCVGLISSGASTEESGFLDASENGDDVFFLTTGKLAQQDTDDSPDVYDAHVCSVQAPCASSSSLTAPTCTTADSCRAAPAPQPGIFGSPASATFSGAGNTVSSVSEPPVAKSKALTRAQKLAAALKACKKDVRKKKRAACEKQARKRYGAVVPSHKAKAKKKGRG